MTYLLDTNVISELRKRHAHPAVVSWANRSRPVQFYISAITIREIEAGILARERVDPAQGAVLRSWFADKVMETYADRVLPVDLTVAVRAASLHVPDPMPERDGLVAATALVHGLVVATRNLRDFERTGAMVVDPWSEEA